MVYKITNYSYKKAEENDLNIVPSKKKNKKIDVYKNGEYIALIGDKWFYDYPTYILDEKYDKSMPMKEENYIIKDITLKVQNMVQIILLK